MHSIHRSPLTAPTPDITGLWFCPPCGEVHGPPPCPHGEKRRVAQDPKRDVGVRLCACCARLAVRSGSPFASFFCEGCGARIVELNRSVGRLVVPVCGSQEANLALLPSPAAGAVRHPDADAGRSFLDSQIELLNEARMYRALFLIDRLRLPDTPLLLEQYLEEVVQLRHESFHAKEAMELLFDRFRDYLIEIPNESPMLAAKVKEKATEFARGFGPEEARRLLASGPTALREAAYPWLMDATVEIQPLPAFLGKHTEQSSWRRRETTIALERAAVRDFERVFGRARRPHPPIVPTRFRAAILAHPGEEWPDYLPPRFPTSARVVVGLQGTPAHPDMPLIVYHLSMDRRHQWWVLWGESVDEEGYVSLAPVAWAPRSRLSAADAGYILLQGSLSLDRETFGMDRPRPRFEMGGLLGEDLTDVLLDALWPEAD